MRDLRKQSTRLFKILKDNQHMNMSAQDHHNFKTAINCCVCGGVLGADRVRDHDHTTGNYRGAAHSDCNRDNARMPTYIPVVFHNLKNYDGHFIVQCISLFRKEFGDDFSCIPTNNEKFMTISWRIKNIPWYGERTGSLEFRFIDSLNFLDSSLDKLAEMVPRDQLNLVRAYAKTDADFEMLSKKGHMPFDFIESIESLNNTSLPPIEQCGSVLKWSYVKSGLRVNDRCLEPL